MIVQIPKLGFVLSFGYLNKFSDTIEDHVDKAVEKVEQGNVELVQAADHKVNSKFLKISIIWIIKMSHHGLINF